MTVEVSQTIWADKAKLVIRGDGSGTFGTGTWAPPWGTAGPPGKWREVEFHLTPTLIEQLGTAQIHASAEPMDKFRGREVTSIPDHSRWPLG